MSSVSEDKFNDDKLSGYYYKSITKGSNGFDANDVFTSLALIN